MYYNLFSFYFLYNLEHRNITSDRKFFLAFILRPMWSTDYHCEEDLEAIDEEVLGLIPG